MKRKYNWPSHIFNFLAVILGVYLGFYINERAKIGQDKKESVALMNSLVSDLSGDIKIYNNFEIPENREQMQNIERLLGLLQTDSIDAISSQLATVFQVENCAPSTSTYSSMKASGKLGLIDNLALQKKLSDYYEGIAIESVKKGEFQVEYFTSQLLPWLTNNVDLIEMRVLNENELVPLRNKLIIYLSLIDQKLNSYQMLVDDSEKVKQKIEAVLESK
ncbi:MAG: hypothetical protein ABR574_08855 [Cryomorphaceae bacterium]|nr:hypothetical protein [Flavobacteriales bacterium]